MIVGFVMVKWTEFRKPTSVHSRVRQLIRDLPENRRVESGRSGLTTRILCLALLSASSRMDNTRVTRWSSYLERSVSINCGSEINVKEGMDTHAVSHKNNKHELAKVSNREHKRLTSISFSLHSLTVDPCDLSPPSLHALFSESLSLSFLFSCRR